MKKIKLVAKTFQLHPVVDVPYIKAVVKALNLTSESAFIRMLIDDHRVGK